MSNVAPLHPTSPSCGHRLGPATVVGVVGAGLRVQRDDGSHGLAQLAVAFPYQPSLGDIVLVICEGERTYVIGVLHQRGGTTLEFSGDVDIRSRDGKVRLRGEEGVELEGPTVDVNTGKLRVVAEAALHTFGWLRQRIRESWDVQAGESRTVVDGTATTQAQEARIVTRGKVAIHGKAVHLG